jgi:hypothetical protein
LGGFNFPRIGASDSPTGFSLSKGIFTQSSISYPHEWI